MKVTNKIMLEKISQYKLSRPNSGGGGGGGTDANSKRLSFRGQSNTRAANTESNSSCSSSTDSLFIRDRQISEVCQRKLFILYEM